MGDGRTQTSGSSRLRALRFRLPPLRGRASVPRGNRKARERSTRTRRSAIAAARRSGEITAAQEEALMAFSAIDHAHMARALRLAELGLYTTQPNPRVGSVLAHGGEIVGEGWH